MPTPTPTPVSGEEATPTPTPPLYPPDLEDTDVIPPTVKDGKCRLWGAEMDFVCIVPPNANYSFSANPMDGKEYYGWNKVSGGLGWWGGEEGIPFIALYGYEVPGVTERPGMDSGYDVTVICACVRGGMHGCFAEGTMITLADHSLKRVEEIKKGDLVLNPVTGKPARVKLVVDAPEPYPLIKLGYAGKSVRVTQTHPMLTVSGLKKAKDLSLEDEVQGEDGSFHKLATIEQLPVEAGQYVFNFELEADSDREAEHMLTADGIVTGDMVLQLKLSQ